MKTDTRMIRVIASSAVAGKDSWRGQVCRKVADTWTTVVNAAGLPIEYMTAEYALDAAKYFRAKLCAPVLGE